MTGTKRCPNAREQNWGGGGATQEAAETWWLVKGDLRWGGEGTKNSIMN